MSTLQALRRKTQREVLAHALSCLGETRSTLDGMGLDELAEQAYQLHESIFCVLRNKTNPKYGGQRDWNGTPTDVFTTDYEVTGSCPFDWVLVRADDYHLMVITPDQIQYFSPKFLRLTPEVHRSGQLDHILDAERYACMQQWDFPTDQ